MSDSQTDIVYIRYLSSKAPLTTSRQTSSVTETWRLITVTSLQQRNMTPCLEVESIKLL